MAGRAIASLSIGALGCWFALAMSASPAAAQYGGGRGTVESPYLIYTAGQLDAIGRTPEHWDKHFRLMADVDLDEYGPEDFHILGASEDAPFSGVFDGNGKTISNLRLVREFGGYLGLFGLVVGDEACIENLTLVNANVFSEIGRYVGALAGGLEQGTIANCRVRTGGVRAYSHVGGLVGRNDGGTITACAVMTLVAGVSRVGGLAGQSCFGIIENCRVEVELVSPSSSYWIGGLVGEVREATVRECRACGTVSGDVCVGGLVGENYLGVIERCCTAGAVAGTTNVGGILGLNSGGSVGDCYATAVVRATTYAGGLVGCNGPSCHCAVYEAGVVDNCYAAGPVTGASSGGLVGRDDRGQVCNSFWDMEASGCVASASAGGDGKTALQMAAISLYATAGWDFVGEKANGTEDVWYMPASGAYPRLMWELVEWDFNADMQVNFRDFSLLAARWRPADSMAGPDSGYSVPDDVADLDDLARFAEVWLAGR